MMAGMKSFTKFFVFLAFSLALFLSQDLFGASGKEVKTLTVWSWMNPNGKTPREVAFKKILDNFGKDYPHIKVEVEPVPWQEIQSKWRASVDIGNAPDVVWLLKAVNDRPKFLLDLDQHVLSKMPKEDIADLYVMNTIESRVGTDKNLVFPLWQTPGSILYYRKDLFEKAGIKAPFKTWDDFIKAGEKLTMDLNGDGKPDVWGYGDSFGERAALATAFTYALADLQPQFYDLKNKKAMFDTENATKAAQMIVEIAKRGIIPKDAISNDLETLLQQFAQGRFAMIQGPAHRYGSIKANVGFGKDNMGIMPWPSWKGDRMGPAFLGYFWEVGITKNTKNVEEASAFMAYLMNKESSITWMEVGQQVPNRKSLLNHPFLSRPENEVLSLSIKIITQNTIFPEPPGFNTVEVPPALGEALMKMMMDGRVQPDLLKRANERINASQK
jgi:multiple sugar transport system substrate-binding protein